MEGGIVSLSEFSSEMEVPKNINKVKIEEVPLYKFAIIASATKNFDMSNRLGVGGFGPVYKVCFNKSITDVTLPYP